MEESKRSDDTFDSGDQGNRDPTLYSSDYQIFEVDAEGNLLPSSKSVNSPQIMTLEFQHSSGQGDELTDAEVTKNEEMGPSEGSTSNRNSQISKLKSQPSPIWDHVIKVKGSSNLKCKYCHKEIKSCGNTTNMLKHLRTQHPLFFQVFKVEPTGQELIVQEPNTQTGSKKVNSQNSSMNKGGIKEAFGRINSYKDGGSMSEKVTNAILFMICKDLLPISTVENEGFLNLMRTVAPVYQPPSRNTMTRRLEARYNNLKQKFIEKLEAVQFYSITCDNWTDCSNQSYIGVTIHYLDEDLQMNSGCLGCVPLFERHTSNYLKNSMLQTFNEFQVSLDKITGIISDAAANIKKTCIELVGTERHLFCLAHVVSHLLPDALTDCPELNEIINKVKSIVTQIRRSIPASDKLKQVQQVQLKNNKTDDTVLQLIQDVKTRFTTKVDMIERYIELETYVYSAMAECDTPSDLLTREEMKVLKDVLPIMVPVRDVITEISGDLYPTCSIIIPIVHCMEKDINSVIPLTEIGREFKTKLKTAIENRFKNFEYSSLLSTATMLDPRFKKIHFVDFRASSSALKRINKKLMEPKNSNSQDLRVRDASEPPTKRIKSLWDFHDSIQDENEEPNTSDSILNYNSELEQYLQLKRILRTENVFAYWKSVEHTFPNLSKIALRYLSVVGTSIPSERLFSRAGLIKRENRNRLTGEHLNMLVFMSSLKSEEWSLQ